MKDLRFKAKYVASRIIAWFPLNALRVNLYRLLGYKIGTKVKIGFGSYIHARRVTIGDKVVIKNANRMYVLDTLIIKQGTTVSSRNTFSGAKFSRGRHPRPNYLEIGENTVITSEHLLDASFGIVVGSGSWIAGRGCSFWSHGSTIPNDTIVIGEGCRFGANCNVGTAVKLGKNCLIGMGSVITKPMPEDNCLIWGVPAKIIKKDYDWHEHWW